jgi:hypothetical protein
MTEENYDFYPADGVNEIALARLHLQLTDYLLSCLLASRAYYSPSPAMAPLSPALALGTIHGYKGHRKRWSKAAENLGFSTSSALPLGDAKFPSSSATPHRPYRGDRPS